MTLDDKMGEDNCTDSIAMVETGKSKKKQRKGKEMHFPKVINNTSYLLIRLIEYKL